ncbi:MAG: nitrite reductase small subunit NirD [Methylovulum sp.]|nr:nitrite reductase small subunit NirD [Methylovulum sp.]
MGWIDVCSTDELQPDSGVGVAVAGQQVALFYMLKDERIYATSNFDPFGNANVLSRGLIGDIGGQPMVASPLYKQHFNLETGVCLEEDAVQIPVYPVRIAEGRVQINIGETA